MKNTYRYIEDTNQMRDLQLILVLMTKTAYVKRVEPAKMCLRT